LRVFSCGESCAQTAVHGRQYHGTGHELGEMLQELGHYLPERWILPDPSCGV